MELAVIERSMAKKYVALSENLSKLLFEHKIRPMDLARELNIPQPTIHRMVAGKSTRPHPSTLEPVANYFNISVDQLTGEKPLAEGPVAPKLPAVHFFPLVTWDSAHFANSTQLVESEHKIIAMADLNPRCYSLVMNDSSMEPAFAKGNILIFDPDKTPKDRNYVLAKLAGSQQLIFRQILIDAEHRYLKPLNPDLSHFGMRLLEENDQVLGVLVEARRNYQE